MSCAMGAAVADHSDANARILVGLLPQLPSYGVEVWKALSFGRFVIIFFRGCG